MCQPVENIIQGKSEIGTRIGIRHRENVNLVDVILITDNVMNTRYQRILEARGINVGNCSHTVIIAAKKRSGIAQ